jgi:RNA polymerase sigma-70 factor (ECF subfamily)
MDRYSEGDESAFPVLYDVLAPYLFGFALNLARHRSLAEDIVQQTFLQIHRARDRWVPGAQVFSWAYAIAHNFFIDSTRRQRHEQLADSETTGADEVPSLEALADEELDSRRRLAWLLRCARQFPEGQRLAFQLVVLEGLSNSEAAEVMGITTGNLKVRLSRAREALRQFTELGRGEGDPVTPSGTT